MKAAHNGVPSLSVLDGWWAEGFIEGITGWAIGPPPGSSVERSAAADAGDLYRTLDQLILPLYRDAGEGWPRLMRSTITLMIATIAFVFLVALSTSPPQRRTT